MTLACEDANSKLVEVVDIAEVDAEKRADDSLMQIWKLKFGQRVDFFRLLQGLVETLKLNFRLKYNVAGVWLRLLN